MSDAVPSKDLVSRGDHLGFFCICLLFGWGGLGWLVFSLPAEL